MVELVTRMMELKKQQARAPKKQSPSAKQLLDQKLAITDHQIDALVYELYGLKEEEIRIAEGREMRTEQDGESPRAPEYYDRRYQPACQRGRHPQLSPRKRPLCVVVATAIFEKSAEQGAADGRTFPDNGCSESALSR